MVPLPLKLRPSLRTPTALKRSSAGGGGLALSNNALMFGSAGSELLGASAVALAGGSLEAGGGSVVGNGVLAVGVELLPDDAGAVAAAAGAGSGAVGAVGAAVTSADGLEPGVGLSSASAGVAMGLAGASLCTGLGVGTELDLRGGGACCDGGRSKETLMARPSSSSSSKNAILCSCSFSQCNTSRCASRVSSSMTTTSDQRREGRPGGRSDAEEASISLV